MDPEIYVFAQLDSAPLKIAASTALFILVLIIAAFVTPMLPGPQPAVVVDKVITLAGAAIHMATLLHVLVGYLIFIYGSYHAWRATRLKNTVEDSKHQLATQILDTGYYGQVRHPMYGMFILANAGLGFAMNSIYGLAFALLSLILFTANGVFEERYVMLRFFGTAYEEYMRRVPARYFTVGQAITIFLVLALYITEFFPA